jgi:predicted MFS family arabinose efflux permease
VVLILGALWIPGSAKERTGGRIDLLGNLVLAAALVAIVLPLVEGRSHGWPLWGWICLAAGVLALIGLTGYESRRRIDRPLLTAALFRKRAFSAGLAIQLLLSGGMSGFFLVFTIWLQSGQGYSPAQAGLLMVAFSAGAFISAPIVDGLVVRMGRNILLIGGLIMAAGLGWVRYATAHASPVHTGAWPLVPGLLIAGVGLGFLIIPLVNIALTAVPGDLASGASGIFSTAQQFGGALGVAVIGDVFFSRAGKDINDAITQAGPWAVGAFLASALLCLALPRNHPAAHHDAA